MDDTLNDLVGATLNLPPGELPPGLSRTNHGAVWTSMRHIQLMVNIEDGYGIALTAAEMAAVDSLDDLRRLVAGKHVRH